MNKDLKLEDRNIDNTHPTELKRLEREDVKNRIEYIKNKIEFSIVSSFFFLFFSAMIISTELVNPYLAIATMVISLVFVAATYFFREDLKTGKIEQRMLELFYKQNNL